MVAIKVIPLQFEFYQHQIDNDAPSPGHLRGKSPPPRHGAQTSRIGAPAPDPTTSTDGPISSRIKSPYRHRGRQYK